MKLALILGLSLFSVTNLANAQNNSTAPRTGADVFSQCVFTFRGVAQKIAWPLSSFEVSETALGGCPTSIARNRNDVGILFTLESFRHAPEKSLWSCFYVRVSMHVRETIHCKLQSTQTP